MNVNLPLNYELRPVTSADAAALQRALWPDRSFAVVHELLQRAEDNARRGRGQGIVAVIRSNQNNQEQVVAFGMLTLWPRTSEISDLMVIAELRNRGIGTAIIYKLIEIARTLHVPSVEIGAAGSNPRALALYQRLGFRDDRVIALDLGSGLEPVIYLVMELR